MIVQVQRKAPSILSYRNVSSALSSTRLESIYLISINKLLPEEGGLPMRLSSPSPCCVDIVRAAVAAAAAAVLADLIYMHV